MQKDHRWLVEFLRPGMAVLDVGCGTGSITAGIANAIGPRGYAAGIDLDESLLACARGEFGNIANLSFLHQDALSIGFESLFDVVTAARALQWMAEPQEAIDRMTQALRPGGAVVVLDYNHAEHAWEPDPPAEFRHFYRAFLAWREANNWDNRIADRLPGMLRAAGLEAVRSVVSDESASRGEADFEKSIGLWRVILSGIGSKITEAGFLTTLERDAAERGYEEYELDRLERQRFSMRTVSGIRR